MSSGELSGEMTLWKRPPEEIKQAAIFLRIQMASQRVDFPSPHIQPAFCRSSKLRPQNQIEDCRIFKKKFKLVLQHAVNVDNGRGYKANFIMVPGMGPV